MTPEIFRKIEYYLYNYDYIDIKIANIRSEISGSEYNQNYSRYIKNKSSSLEDQVIKNIGIEQRIYKIKKWKNLINLVLRKYKSTSKEYYYFINLKYFCKVSPFTIQEKLNLTLKQQKDIQAEILQYIFFIAVKKEMLRNEYWR